MRTEPAPLRVLVVSDEMEVGGSQRQITYLLGGLDRTRWQPELAFFRNRSFLVDQLDLPVHHLPKRGRIDPGFMWRYLKLVRSGRYDIVHAFSLTAELYTAMACLTMRKPPKLVASIRGMYLLQPGWFWRIKRWILDRADAVIANAQAGAQAAAQRAGLGLERFDVIPNGVVIPDVLDADARAALRRRLGVPDGRRFGLFVGRLVHQKNPSCLLRALARLDETQRPWVAMAGDGPLRAEVEQQRAAEALQEDLMLLGERSDTSALMQAADFLVLPSLHEGMPNVLLEAMAAGCPIIASDVGGNPELIESGRNGLLFGNDDDEALAQAIARMCTQAGLAAHLATAACSDVQARYSIRAMVDATEGVYLRCLEPTLAARNQSTGSPLPSNGDSTSA